MQPPTFTLCPPRLREKAAINLRKDLGAGREQVGVLFDIQRDVPISELRNELWDGADDLECSRVVMCETRATQSNLLKGMPAAMSTDTASGKMNESKTSEASSESGKKCRRTRCFSSSSSACA